MGLIKDNSYIEKIGIKEVLFTTRLDNTIYLLNNGKKYKRFNESFNDLSDSINVSFKKNLIQQTDYYSDDLISFPEMVISDEHTLYGIVSDYEKGTPLSKIDPLTEIDQLIHIIETLEKGTINISDKGWNLEDLHEDNIIINGDSSDKPVRIIDTDFYLLQIQRDRLELYRNNMKKIFASVINTVLPRIFISSILEDKEIKRSYLLACNGLIKCSEFLKTLLVKLKMTYLKGQNIKTLQKTIK
ncbi:MAG: hypothetical protein ACI4XM_08005 [Candidatus Coprovivens sp.]